MRGWVGSWELFQLLSWRFVMKVDEEIGQKDIKTYDHDHSSWMSSTKRVIQKRRLNEIGLPPKPPAMSPCWTWFLQKFDDLNRIQNFLSEKIHQFTLSPQFLNVGITYSALKSVQCRTQQTQDRLHACHPKFIASVISRKMSAKVETERGTKELTSWLIDKEQVTIGQKTGNPRNLHSAFCTALIEN